MADTLIEAMSAIAGDRVAEDTQLMLAVKAGDQAAFTALMTRWELPVKSVIGRIVLNASEAEELAQETFVKVWTHRDFFRSNAVFRPWIFAIAVNLARNRLRWWKRRPHVVWDEWDEVRIPSSASRAGEASVLNQMIHTERAEAVRRAVALLPVSLREVLTLSAFHELSHAEVAGILAISVKAVETRLHRARLKLRETLSPWLEQA